MDSFQSTESTVVHPQETHWLRPSLREGSSLDKFLNGRGSDGRTDAGDMNSCAGNRGIGSFWIWRFSEGYPQFSSVLDWDVPLETSYWGTSIYGNNHQTLVYWWFKWQTCRCRQQKCEIVYTVSGWWFGTFFIFPYIVNNHPHWLIFFQRGSNHQPGIRVYHQTYGDDVGNSWKLGIDQRSDMISPCHGRSVPIGSMYAIYIYGNIW